MYNCRICEKSFSRNWNLDRHLKDVHDLIFTSDSTLKVSDKTKPSDNYLKKGIGSNPKKWKIEIPSSIYDYYQDPAYNLHRDDYSTENYNFFQNHNENLWENNLFDHKDDLNDNEEISLRRLWIKIQPRLEMLRNHYYRRNPHLAYSPFTNLNKHQLCAFLMYLGYRCISEKSTYPVDRLLRKYGYRIP